MKTVLERIAIAAFGLLTMAALTSCGGGSSPAAITVKSGSSLMQVDVNGQVMLTSTVSNDSSGKGVAFGAPTCGAPPPAGGCGTVTNVMTNTANGTSTTTATYTAPTSDLNVMIPVTLNANGTAETPIAIVVVADPTIAASLTATIGQACPALVTSGTPPYTLTVTSGSLPAWVNFNNGTGAVCAGNVPANATTGSFSAKVTDAGSGSSGANATAVTITVPIIITTASPLATGEVTQASYTSGSLAFEGGSGTPAAANPWSITAGGAALTAAGLSFNTTTGAVTGAPSTACSACAFTVQFTDSLGAMGSKAFNLAIVPRVAVAAPPGASLNATIGSAYTLTLATTAGTGQGALSNWTLASGTLPTGLPSPVAATGVITGTPTDAASGPSFTVTVTDSLGVTSLPSAPITINVAILISTASLPGGELSAAYNSGAPAANTGTGTGITWTATGLPAWASINAATGAITGATPTAGNSTPTIKVTDARGATGSKQFTITINSKLTITSSGALAAGTVNAAYNGGNGVQLAATGGVAPLGNWSGPATGSLPTGLSVSGSGLISGTPQCPIGTFPFTVTLGPDADGVSAASAGLSITTTTTALTINQVNSQQQATVATAFSLQLGTSGGVCSPTIAWSVVSGALPASGWLTLNPSTGLLSGTPGAGDVGMSSFTVQATDGTSSPQVAVTVTVAAGHTPGPNADQMSGPFAFQARGFDASGKLVAMAGSFTADGKGDITAGTMDVNTFSGGPSTDLTINTATSFYSLGPGERGQLSLATSAGTFTFDISAGDLFSAPPAPPLPFMIHLGHLISSQTSASNGFAVSGVFTPQATSSTLSTVVGDFAFGSEGVDSGGNRVATAGRQTVTSTGSITNGEIDVNDAGTVNGPPLGAGAAEPLAFTGSVDNAAGTPIDPNTGRGTLTLTITGGSTLHFAFYVVNGGEIYLVSTDKADSAHDIVTSHGLRQSTTFCPTTGACAFNSNPAPLNGISIIYQQGESTTTAGASRVDIGAITFTSTGAGTGSLSGGFDENDGGTILTASSNKVSGNFSVTANGRVTLTNAGQQSPIFYMIGANNLFLVGGGSSVAAGTGEPQSGLPFAFMVGDGGSYCFGTQAPALSGSTVFDGLQTVIPSSSTMAPASGYTLDLNSLTGGLMEDVSVNSVTLTVDTTGRFTFNDGGNKVGYMVSFNSQGEFTRSIAIDASSTNPTIIFNDRIIHEVMLQ